MPVLAGKRPSLILVHGALSLLLNVLVLMWDSLNYEPVGDHFRVIPVGLPFSAMGKHIMCNCEEFKEMILFGHIE